jgi:hypothetical protein
VTFHQARKIKMPRPIPAPINGRFALFDDNVLKYQEKDIFYTKMELSCPAEYLDEDLSFSSSPQQGSTSTRLILDLYVGPSWRYIATVTALAGLFCYLSGGISGLVLFKQWNRFALNGLLGLLTLIGLGFAVSYSLSRRGEEPGILQFLVVFTIVYHVLWLSLFSAFSGFSLV